MDTTTTTTTAEGRLAPSLAEAQPGDRLLLKSFRLEHDIVTVDRATASSLWIAGIRYHRRSGKRVGDSGSVWDRPPWLESCDEATAARVQAESRRRHLVRAVAAVNWKTLPVEALMEIYRIVRATTTTTTTTTTTP